MRFPSAAYTRTLSPAPTINWIASGWKQVAWILQVDFSFKTIRFDYRFQAHLAKSLLSLCSWIFSTHFGMARMLAELRVILLMLRARCVAYFNLFIEAWYFQKPIVCLHYSNLCVNCVTSSFEVTAMWSKQIQEWLEVFYFRMQGILSRIEKSLWAQD